MKTLRLLLAASLALAPTSAFAHPGASLVPTFATGFLHPMTGVDHVLAMMTVGLWAAQRRGPALWLWPATFVSAMIAGGALGMAGVALPMVEPVIWASVLVIGVAALAAAPAPAWAGAAMLAFFALFHGDAHGLEAPVNSNGFAYGAGFVLATALLQGVGIGLGFGLARIGWTRRTLRTAAS